MEDQYLNKTREQRVKQLKRKIHDPNYLQQAVRQLAGNLAREYYQRTQR